MIVKMKFLSITGPRADIDRVVETYLSKYEIHLENALSELKTVQDLKPFMEINPYKDVLAKAKEYLAYTEDYELPEHSSISLDDALQTVKNMDSSIEEIRRKRIELEDKREKLQLSAKNIEPFRQLPYNVHTILNFQFIKFRFGKISLEYFSKFEKYVYDNLDTVFFKSHSDGEYVWGVYFVPATLAHKIDAIYSSLHFERFFLPDEYSGTPEEAYKDLTQKIDILTSKIDSYTAEITQIIRDMQDRLLHAASKLNSLSRNFDVRKLAACTNEGKKTFYIICGWMPEKDAGSLQKEIANDENLYCIVEDDHNNIFSSPPTKLKNPKIVKPFEMFIKMYGLPAHNEIDPTIFVALTYSFIFGAMFGDVGQGLCLLIGGFLLYHFKKMDLAAVISSAGFFSTIFGFLYGSVFGFEDVIPALWLHPVSHMSNVPFIGKLNTVFVVAIGFGMGIILLSMIFHIINGIKAKDTENTWFDTNGIAGLVFYGSLVLSAGLFMAGKTLPGGIVLAVMFGLPLILIALKEPLSKLIEKKTGAFPKQKGMFILQMFFELFEVLLSYFSNTLSFVRIGAFAVSHAAMMEVVLMLAGAENGASPNLLVIILGNLIVCGMEGLIVGIQVLRLEYYEIFSRFYKGNGRAFTPFNK